MSFLKMRRSWLTWMLVTLSLITSVRSSATSSEETIKKYVEVCEAQVKGLHEQVDTYKKIYGTCKEQRNEAVEASSDKGYPFYFWILIGAAGGVVLTRGLR